MRGAGLVFCLVLLCGCSLGPGATSAASHHAARPHPKVLDSASAEPGWNPHLPVGEKTLRVPILMYHYVRTVSQRVDPLGYDLSVTPGDFAAQMDWLQRQGYQAVTFDDIAEYFAGTGELPLKPIVLTFDDGYQDFYSTALPILTSHHFRAVSYVISRLMGSRYYYMTAQQVLALDKQGIEIGSHTEHHVDLTRLQPAALRDEVAGSKSDLEALLHHQVLDFCYPSGRFNAVVLQAVQAAGYRDATTTQPGSDHSWSDRYSWTRVRVSGGETLSRFAGALGSA